MAASGSPSGSELSALYDRHFTVVAADTPDLLDAAHALRYQVYCVEHRFEDPAEHRDERERDRYDRHSAQMSLGLLRGVGQLAARHGMETVFSAMAPSLMRLLERFGLMFERLGPLIDFHGSRQPCIGECEQLLAGMADCNGDYHRLVAQAYHAETFRTGV